MQSTGLLLWAALALQVAAGDEPRAAPGTMPLAKAVVVSAAGETTLQPGQQNAIEPDARFRIELAARLTDVRLQLLDDQDVAVPSAGTSEALATTRLSLTPSEPLRAGTVYRLRLDGAVERESHDGSGARYAPMEIQVKTAGEKLPPQKKRTKRSRRSK